MTTFLGMLLVALATAAVGWPLFRKATASAPVTEPNDFLLSDLLSQREATYAAISELDADREMGNLSDGDHRELRQRYEDKAMAILKAIDELGQGNGANRVAAMADDLLSEEIEEEVRRSRQKGAGQTNSGSTIVCHSCGSRLAADARFCSCCGARLALVCSGCGATRASGDRFCARCGMEMEPVNV